MFCIAALVCFEVVAFIGARVRSRRMPALDCAENVSINLGTTCPNGTLYAGEINGNRYLITPGGCGQEPSGTTTSYPTNDFTATCSGVDDTTTKAWRQSVVIFDVPGVENIATVATPSTNLGDANSAILVGLVDYADGGPHPAARYCDRMDFGGFTDWYLPSKSELTYLYCKSRTTGNATYPNEDPDCAGIGYATITSFIPNFNTGIYYSSTEVSASSANQMRFSDGLQASSTKGTAHYVRCIRRVGPDFIASISGPGGYSGSLQVTGLDVDYDAVPESTSQTITIKNSGDKPATGVSASVSSGFEIVGGSCHPAVALPIGATCTVEVKGVSTNRWENGPFTGVLTLSNSGKSSRVDLAGTTTDLPDPCYRPGAPIGALCDNGTYYGGVFQSGGYMVAPGGCAQEPSGTNLTYPNDEFTPVCSGVDTMTKRWNQSGSTSFDIPTVENVGTVTTASTVLGNLNSREITKITDLTQGGYHPAARYCDRLELGGFQDWYLPSKSELTYLACKAKRSASIASFPQQDPDCATYGYGTTGAYIKGFDLAGATFYLSSTEWAAASIWTINFMTILDTTGAKSDSNLVRCIRRMGPHFVASPPSPGDFDVDAIVTGLDVNYTASPESTAVTVTVRNQGDLSSTGVTSSVSAGFEITGGTCSPIVALAVGQTCTILIKGTSLDRWYNGAFTGTLTLSDGDRTSYVALSGASTNLPDPCTRPSPPTGVRCDDGTHFVGSYAGATYYVTPGGCAYESSGTTTSAPSSNFTPSCPGTTDAMTKSFKGSGASDYNVPGVEDVTSPNPSTVLGDANTTALAAITDSAQGGPYPGARYCEWLNYGGHTDWYLPSKSELAFVGCKSKASAATYPQEDPGCANFGLGSSTPILPGGLPSVVPGVASAVYWTSTESSTMSVHQINMTNLMQAGTLTRNTAYRIRCVRRE